MTEELREDNKTFAVHVLVCIIYAILIVSFYSPVIFGGKSLLPALYQPHGVTARGVYGEKGRTPVNTFNVDTATPAFYEFPVNKLVGDMYRDGHIPLWNPYQGGGTPLAAQYSTRAFFPYQIAEDLAPVSSWDYFLLGRLLIAGFFTYLFLLSLGAEPWSAFAGGLFYMFSGVFTWFISLEQLTNTAMMVPVLLLSLDILARGVPRARWVKVKIVFAAFCFALTLLAGQPETALYVLTLALLYYLFRAFTSHGIGAGLMTIPRIAIAFVTGLALSSPMILLFVELVQKGAHIHHAGGLMGTQRLANWRALFNIITPTLSYFPADPETIKGTSLLVKAGEGFFRFLPINGVWDTLGGYTGVLPLFLIISGIFISPLRKKLPLRKDFFFFILIAALVLLKNAGIKPFYLIGKAPLFDIVWSLRWAGPVWVFAIAVAAALGLGLIDTHLKLYAKESASGEKTPVIPRGVVFILTAGLIGGVYIVYSFIPSIGIFMHRGDVFNGAMSPFVFPSIIGGSVLTLIVIAVAFAVTYFWKDEKNVYALLVLAVLELWWAIPRGYAPESLAMKWAPLVVGLVAVFFFFRNKLTFAFMALVVFFVAAFFMDSLAPNGYPPRDDPFKPAPYVSAIRHDSAGMRPRVAGAYGALIPNYAGAVKLDDLRYVNSIVPETLQSFRNNYLYEKSAEGLSESSLWFTGSPERSARVDKDGAHLYKRIESLPEDDFVHMERAYSLLGVRYFIFPDAESSAGAESEIADTFKEKFPLIYDKADARVYKNPDALPRVFLATETLKAPSWQEAQKAFMEGEFNPARTIVIEEDVESTTTSSHLSPLKAYIRATAESSGISAFFTPASAEAASEVNAPLVPLSAPAPMGVENAKEAVSGHVKGTPPVAGPEIKASEKAAEKVSPLPANAHPMTTVPEAVVAPAESAPETTRTAPGALAPEMPVAEPVVNKAPESQKALPEGTATEKALTEPVTEKAPKKVLKGPTEVHPGEPVHSPAEKATGAAPTKALKEDSDTTKPEGPPEAASETQPQEEPEAAEAPGPETPIAESVMDKAAEVDLEAAAERALNQYGAFIREYSPTKVTVDVRADKASVLVLGDIFYPGWKVKVNDDKTKIIRVNGLLRGVPVKEGRSRVVFYYMPLYFLLGLLFMVLSGIFCIYLIFRDLKGD